jgi:hypothetical protein
MSSTLDAVRETEGKTLDELEQQLEQSRQIFNSMQDNLMGNILQNLISVVLNCDKDGDMVLSDEEIDTIILKIEGINGIDLNDELLREALVQNGRSLNGRNTCMSCHWLYGNCHSRVLVVVVVSMFSHFGSCSQCLGRYSRA